MEIKSNYCSITKHMPIGAFIVFALSFMFFVYILFIDSKETGDERSTTESAWIALFFILLLTSVGVSGYCMIKKNDVKLAGKVDKKINLLKEKFYDGIPDFKGNKNV